MIWKNYESLFKLTVTLAIMELTIKSVRQAGGAVRLMPNLSL